MAKATTAKKPVKKAARAKRPAPPARVMLLKDGVRTPFFGPTSWPADIALGATVQIVSSTSPWQIDYYMVVDKGRWWDVNQWKPQDTIAMATQSDLQDENIAEFRRRVLRSRGWDL